MSSPQIVATPTRTILWKELHETLKIGAFALVLVGGARLVVLAFEHLMASQEVVLAGGPGFHVSLFTFTSALAALVIGRAQIVRESRGDRWAFLTHRPVTRTTLFLGKVGAGVPIYLVAAGIPLVVAAYWYATPGHRPMPFDARMMLPDVADWLCGLVYYFAALLVGMREARWFGSRYLPIIGAIICTVTELSVSTFSLALSVIVVGVAIAGTAAWGSFVGGGQYESQPRVARAALGTLMACGISVVATIAFAVFGIVTSLNGVDLKEPRSTGYAIAADGALVRDSTVLRIFAGGKKDVVALTSLDRKPLSQYADSAARERFAAGVVTTADLPVGPAGAVDNQYRDRGYRGTDNILVYLAPAAPVPTPVSWYFVRGEHLIAGYDNRSALLIGWVGPDGFATGTAKPATRFAGELDRYSEIEYRQPLLTFPHAVYRVDLQTRAIRKVFTATAGESVLAAATSGDSIVAIHTLGPRALFDVVATNRAVYVQSPDGTPQFAVPRDSGSKLGVLAVSRATLASGTPTFLWYSEKSTYPPGTHRGGRVVEVNDGGGVISETALVADSTPAASDKWNLGDILTMSVMPVTASLVSSANRRRFSASRVWGVAIVVSILSALLTLALGRRFAFGPGRLKVWAVIGFALGPLGGLLMLSLFDSPVRELCSSCHRQRVVTRERCEHCDAPFPPPALEGTELFPNAIGGIAIAIALLVAVPRELPAQNQSAWTISWVATIDSGPGHQKLSTSSGSRVLGDKIRLNMSISSATPADMYMILDSSAGTLTTVMPSRQLAMVANPSMGNAGRPALWKMDMGPNPTYEVVDLGAGEPILGRPTHHYRESIAYEALITIGDESCSRRSKQTSDVWVTPQADLPEAGADMQRFANGLSSSGFGDFAAKLKVLSSGKWTGFVLKRDGFVRGATPAGDSTTVHTTWQITELKHEVASAADFEIPDGFQVMDTRDMMADPAAMADAMSAAMSAAKEPLKKLMCGK